MGTIKHTTLEKSDRKVHKFKGSINDRAAIAHLQFYRKQNVYRCVVFHSLPSPVLKLLNICMMQSMLNIK